MKNTLEDAYAIEPQDMDTTLVAMLSTKTRNKVKDALKDDGIEFSQAVPDAACRAAIIATNSVFSKKQKAIIVEAVKHCTSDKELTEAVDAIKRNSEAFRGLNKRNVQNWIQNAQHSELFEHSKRGRKVNYNFETSVWDELVIWGVHECMKPPAVGIGPAQLVKTATVVRCIAFSYEIIRCRCRKVQSSNQYLADAKVQLLKFSNNWIKKFLRRHKVSRRRITSERKQTLSPDAVQQIMLRHQQQIREGGYLPRQILNLDETALNFGIGPTYIYIPIDADRAVAEASNVKARITCVPIVDAEGTFLPMMFILKHSKSSDKFPDQTTMTVISNLNKKEGYTPQDGWHLDVWRRELTIKKGNVEKTKEHLVK
jgi:hypothetical protein